MDRRVAIIRFWLLCIASLAVAVCWPQLGVGLWPVAFLFPSCACCNVVLDCTTVCSDGPTTVSLTIAGIVNEDCLNCANYNQTFVTDVYTALSSNTICVFDYNFGPECDPASAPDLDNINLQLRVVGGQANIRVAMLIESQVAGGPDDQIARWSNSSYTNGTDIGAGPLDCGALSTVTLALVDDFNGGASADDCDASASTCDVDF